MYYSDSTLRQVLVKAGWTVEATFTIGIGLDEFLVQSETSQRETNGSGEPRRIPSAPQRRLRHFVRDAFLGLGIGENLGAIAYPARS
jgi:hypothetical protein